MRRGVIGLLMLASCLVGNPAYQAETGADSRGSGTTMAGSTGVVTSSGETATADPDADVSEGDTIATDVTGEPPPSPSGRGLIAQYSFVDVTRVVRDVSGVDPPLDLLIYRGDHIELLDHGVRFMSSDFGLPIDDPDHTTPIIRSVGPADKVNGAIRDTNEFTLEVWMRSEMDQQDGPARIVTLGVSRLLGTNLNLLHGPEECSARPGDALQVRIGGADQACPPLPMPDVPEINHQLQHVVLTQRDLEWRIYLDGALYENGTHTARPSDWNDMAGMSLGNQIFVGQEGAADTNTRSWVGSLFYVGWHSVALTEEEVQANAAIPYEAR